MHGDGPTSLSAAAELTFASIFFGFTAPDPADRVAAEPKNRPPTPAAAATHQF
jgi:hypothetical protein